MGYQIYFRTIKCYLADILFHVINFYLINLISVLFMVNTIYSDTIRLKTFINTLFNGLHIILSNPMGNAKTAIN